VRFLPATRQALLEVVDGGVALGLAGSGLSVGGEVGVPFGEDRVCAVHRRAADLGFFVEVLFGEAAVGPLRAAFEESGHRRPKGGGGLRADLVFEVAVGRTGHWGSPTILSTLRVMSSSRSARSRRQAGMVELLMSWSCLRWWES
jgi:hypothetical protein